MSSKSIKAILRYRGNERMDEETDGHTDIPHFISPFSLLCGFKISPIIYVLLKAYPPNNSKNVPKVVYTKSDKVRILYLQTFSSYLTKPKKGAESPPPPHLGWNRVKLLHLKEIMVKFQDQNTTLMGYASRILQCSGFASMWGGGGGGANHRHFMQVKHMHIPAHTGTTTIKMAAHN